MATTYVAVVPTIYNAALNGLQAGFQAGKSKLQTDGTQADYNADTNVCSAIAQEIDTTLGADATLATAGATVVPATAANQNAAVSKPALMLALCFAAAYNRSPGQDVTVADYGTIAAAIIACYKATFAQQSIL